jgi:hypothetical protein
LEPQSESAVIAVIQETASAVDQTTADQYVEAAPPKDAPPWWDGTGIEIVRATRSWVQYGTVAFAAICIIIGAVEALFGR